MYITHSMTSKITARQLVTAAQRFLVICADAQLRGNTAVDNSTQGEMFTVRVYSLSWEISHLRCTL